MGSGDTRIEPAAAQADASGRTVVSVRNDWSIVF
jgi:hypothetical protein